MSVNDILQAVVAVRLDGKFEESELRTVGDSAGKLSDNEYQAMLEQLDLLIEDAWFGRIQLDDTPAQATQDDVSESVTFARLYYARKDLGDLKDPQKYGSIPYWRNVVRSEEPVLAARERANMDLNTTTFSRAGEQIKTATKMAVQDAWSKGAVAYDPRDVEERPEWNDEHSAFEYRGTFNPYVQELDGDVSAWSDPMAFENTSLSPERIAELMTQPQTYNQITGRTSLERDGNSFDFVTYTANEGVWDGNISNSYDESFHTDGFARGYGGAPFVSNAVIDSDGDVHVLPFARHTPQTHYLPFSPTPDEAAEIGTSTRNFPVVPDQPQVHVLTTNSLARGARLFYMGHLGMRDGVVTSFPMSGRLGKTIVREELKIPNPITMMKAKGLEVDEASVLASMFSSVRGDERDQIWLNPDTDMIEKKPAV